MTVQMTCVVEDLPTLRWFFNQTEVAKYIARQSDIIPPERTLDSSLLRVPIKVVRARPDSMNSDLIDAVSTLTTNTSVLQDFGQISIQCGSNRVVSTPVNVTEVSVRGISRVYKDMLI